MKELKTALITIYCLIGACFWIYGGIWGDFAHKGFAWNFGRSLIWPTIIFPSLGQAIGGIIIVGVIIWGLLNQK